MRTYILMWNPAISSVKMDEFENYIIDPTQELNWSVWDYEDLDFEDRFFLVRVGEGNTGIVMSGTFVSLPWQGEDWRGKGREVFYADLDAESIFHPDREPIITTAQLQEAIPDFDWTDGHSGRVLTNEQAQKLEALYMDFILQRYAAYGEVDDFYDIETPNAYISSNALYPNAHLQEYLHRTRGESCELCGYNYQEKFGADNPHHNDYILIGNALDGLSLKDFHCLCRSCREMERAPGIAEKLRHS